MKYLKRTLVVVLLILIGGLVYNYPKLNIISGYAAKNMASSIYIASRSAESITQFDNNVPLIKLADTDIEQDNFRVSASVFGLMTRKAVFRKGLGCVLLNNESAQTTTLFQPRRTTFNTGLTFPYGRKEARDTVFDNIDYQALNITIDKAFANPEIQKTRTALVVYKDHIIAEKYRNGFTKETPILGWSMTKSVLATLFGILEYQKRINIETYRPYTIHKEFGADETDPRRAISLNHLLRMQSGLEWEEDYTSISDVTRMLFLDENMTKTQAIKEDIAPPEHIWNYSSGTTNFLSGILRKELGSYQEYLDFPYRELIDKIGMNSMLIEADLCGNYVGSSYGWANTRDWAKFGMLYLHRGKWSEKQLFAPDWVDYITTPTEHSKGVYGAHFWLNAGGKYPDVPDDLFSANGYQGQFVFIIPSKELVIVRTGLAEAPDFDVNSFLKGIVDAIH